MRNVMVVGSGGREHALSLRLLESESVGEVIVVPGNGGTVEAPAWIPRTKRLWCVRRTPQEVARSEPIDLAVIGPGRVSFTSSQLAFRYQDSDIRLAFTRLGRVLQKNGTSFQRVVKSNIYPISLALAGKIRSLGFEFFDRTNPPANTTVELEGLASLDASFAMDVVAAVP